MNRLKYLKKGSLMDAIYMPMYLLILAMTIILAVYVWGQISTTIEPVMNQTVNNTGELIDNIDAGFSSLDYMFPFIVGGLLIVSLIFAFRTGVNVLYGIMAFILWVFAVFISVVYANVFGEFIDYFTTTEASFPIIYYIITNIKWVVIGWVFLISAVMFTRNKREDDNIKFQDQFQQ